ncbi:uncharacterized protein LTR77_006784 [Saxophila tyrrhenica]|uniref:NTF2-like domain-containing protein n=1 Tax=Saxophila tyrrhenica TaxID=1690608 RepID=A0AAV9P5M0_9PEZI|nr:hypothetical protein LTR77_006784 [Saxophila tyrrhenica]
MRTGTIFAAALAFASSVIATPAPKGKGVGKPKPPPCRAGIDRPGCVGKPKPKKECKTCMSEEDAQIVASYFQDLIRGYTIEQALAGLTEDFVDYSSAVSIVINKGAAVPNDITQPIFTSREQFMAGHGKQKPIPFEILDVWHNCNGTVSMRWVSTRSAYLQPTEAAAIPVPALVVLETEPAEEGNEYNYRIHTIYSEFNAAAWLVNLGVFKPEGAVTPVPADVPEGTEGEAEAAPAKREIAARTPEFQDWTDIGVI